MKRILAILGVVALLGTLFVLASSPASAGSTGNGGPPEQLGIYNRGEAPLTVTALTGCNAITKTPFDVAGGEIFYAQFEHAYKGCKATIVAQDAAGQCTMEVGQRDGVPLPDGGVQFIDGTTIVKGYDGEGFGTPYANFRVSDYRGNCVIDRDIEINKYLADESHEAQASLTTFDFGVTSADSSGTPDASVCADSNTSASVVGAPESVSVDVLNGYLDAAKNIIVPCYYLVSEAPPAGWTLVDVNNDDYCSGPGPKAAGGCEEPSNSNGSGQSCNVWEDTDAGVALVRMQRDQSDPRAVEEGTPDCDVAFVNYANPVPIIVTKTFVGRTEYSTLDRADFHVFSPGNCSGIPIDPFGNLLGSTGYFRTVNASQDTQFVIAPPGTSDALPSIDIRTAAFNLAHDVVKCTYRVQETHAPDGCTPLGATGSNADGPYWEQTWDVGVTSMVFPIVNDCAEVIPEVVDPPKKGAAAKPGAKKPSGGGTAAPKFTG